MLAIYGFFIYFIISIVFFVVKGSNKPLNLLIGLSWPISIPVLLLMKVIK